MHCPACGEPMEESAARIMDTRCIRYDCLNPRCEGAALVAAKKCPRCGGTMDEEEVVEKDDKGNIIRRYKRYSCPNPRCNG